MTADLSGLDRCPSCGAAVKHGDPWCTLCYADLRPPAPPPPPHSPPPPPAARPVPVAPPADPLTDPIAPSPSYRPSVVAGPDPLDAGSGPTWPCAACGAVNRMERDTCAGCGLPFLSGLREQEAPLLELPVVGDLTKLGRGQRFALAGGVVLVFVVLTLLLGLLFG